MSWTTPPQRGPQWRYALRVALAPWVAASVLISSPALGELSQPAAIEAEAQVDSAQDKAAAEEPGDDLDKLLDLDIDRLSETQVSSSGPLTATLTDPVVESVSKAPEKSSEAPGIVDVITAEEIEAYGAKNLYEVLERATSVYMTGSFMHRRNLASIRGNLIKHEDDHVLILINGRPFRDSTLGGVHHSVYTAFPIQTIARVEVLRGPGSVLYGTNAFTGVINIVTKRPDKPTAYASALAGSDGWQSYALGGGAGDGTDGLYVGASTFRQEGWPFTATLEDSITDTGLYGEDSVGVFASYRRGGFSANVFAANAQQSNVGAVATWPLYESHDPRLFVDLGYGYEIDERQRLQFNFTYNYDGFDTASAFSTPTDIVLYKADSWGYLVEATYSAAVTERLNLLLGGLADTHQGGDSFNAIPYFTETWYGVYMQLDYKPTDWLKLVGGMQGNMPGEVRGGIVPRAGVIVSFTEEWTGKFLYGQAFRSPYQLERSINAPPVIVGNPGLNPETIQTFDLQIAYQTDEFRLATTLFHSDFSGVVSRVGTTPQTYVNDGTITYQGVEIENDWKLDEFWSWVGSVTYQANDRGGVDNTTYVPNWMAKMGLAYDNKQTGFRAGLFDTFYGRPTVPPTAAAVNPTPRAYHLVSLNTTLDLNRYLDLRTGAAMRAQFLVQNLFNERIDHVEFEREVINSIPAGPGTTCYGGFSLDY